MSRQLLEVELDELVANLPSADLPQLKPHQPSTSKVFIPEEPHTEFSWSKLKAFMGPGFLVSIAYIDPGNLDADIQAGAQFQFQLIWILFVATILGLLLQTLSARLGIITGLNLAQMCRREYSGRLRLLLWLLAEIAVIASDIPEVIGTAIALRLLFGLPLYAGVIVTSVSVLIFLMINYYGVRKLEALIASLVAIILTCFLIEALLSDVSVGGVLSGFLPTLSRGSLYSSTALIGSVIMPHNLFLHSALVQSREIGRSTFQLTEACRYNLIESGIALMISFVINVSVIAIAATDFFPSSDVGLQNAPDLLETLLGSGRAVGIIFAIGLLASGQSSTMTGTFAGQFVMEGFLELRVKAWVRAAITRGMAIVPSLVVALVAGERGADALIILSQAMLSVLLPFSLIPLVKFTNNPAKMSGFHNSRKLANVVGLLGLLVTVANLALVWGIVLPALATVQSVAGRVFAWLGVLVLGLCYIGLIAHLIRRPLSANELML